MSTQPVRRVPASRLALEFPQSLAVFDSYEEAQKAVDYLSDHEFPVENVLIVGTDLKQIERVTGRLTRGRVMVGGAMSGAWLGAFVAVVFALRHPSGQRDQLPHHHPRRRDLLVGLGAHRLCDDRWAARLHLDPAGRGDQIRSPRAPPRCRARELVAEMDLYHYS